MNNNDEEPSLLDSLFPLGQERWVRVKYHDRQKSQQAFRLYHNEEAKLASIDKLGYETTAIGVREEYFPQVSALLDLKEDILRLFMGHDDEHIKNLTEFINHKFKAKIEEVKQHTIKYETNS